MRYTAMVTATLLAAVVSIPVLAEQAPAPEKTPQTAEAQVEQPVTGQRESRGPMHGKHCKHGSGQYGKGRCAMGHGCKHEAGHDGMQHGSGQHGKGKRGSARHAQVVQRLDRIEQRMARLEAHMARVEDMLESMMWR